MGKKKKASEKFAQEHANGNSQFLKISETSEVCERAYKSYLKKHPNQPTGNLLAIYHMLDLLDEIGPLHLEWLYGSVKNIVKEMIVDGSGIGKGRHKNTRAQYISHFIDFRRYETVSNYVDQGETVIKSSQKAQEALKKDYAQGSPRAMRDSYYKVKKQLKTSSGRDLYINFPRVHKVLAGIESKSIQ